MKNVSECTSKTNQLRDQPSKLMQTSFRDARKATGRPNVSKDCHSGSQMDSLGTSRRKNFAVSETRSLSPLCKRTPMPCGQLSYKNWYNWDWYNAQMKKTCGLLAVLWSPLWKQFETRFNQDSGARKCCSKLRLELISLYIVQDRRCPYRPRSKRGQGLNFTNRRWIVVNLRSQRR